MRYFQGIDILRFMAACFVVLFHHSTYGLYAVDNHAGLVDRAFPWLAPFEYIGWIGVQIFFVISGLLIAASALKMPSSVFIKKRAIRLMPTLWVATTVTLIICLILGVDPSADLLLAYLRSMILFPIGPYLDGVVWTIIIEVIFYSLIAVVIRNSSVPESRQNILDRVAFSIGGVSCVFLFVQAICGLLNPVLMGIEFSEITDRYFFNLFLLRHGVYFGLGMLIWSMSIRGINRNKFIACCLFTVFAALEIGIKSEFSAYYPIVLSIWVISLAFLIFSVVDGSKLNFGPRQKNIIRLLGLMTYPLYLCHYAIGYYMTPALAPLVKPLFTPVLGSVVLWGTLLAFTILIALILTLYIEPWTQSKMKKYLFETQEFSLKNLFWRRRRSRDLKFSWEEMEQKNERAEDGEKKQFGVVRSSHHFGTRSA